MANRLRLTPRTIYAWLRQGRLRGKKLGRVWRIRPEDVDACVGTDDRDRLPDMVREGEGGDPMELVRMAREYMSHVPDEERESVPPDLGVNHDHYLYGCKKRWEG